MLTDVKNDLVDTELLVPAYVAITKIPATWTPPHTHTREPHPYLRYMVDVIFAVKGGPK